ncbi:MAG TPA: LLM class flavin-dependent oxidoreductase [Rhodospirillales bacterium]|nr:LLM class flavin-dependent oxidoreductase [Rhodospirillales bacterium]
MDFGINLAPAADSWKVVERAEKLGFSHAWFYDTQLLNADVFVAMAAAAVKTERIRLGTGVLIPSNRIAPVTASALASLNKLAPGRIDFGVATGFTARRTMGLGAVKLDDVREYVRIVRALLERETTEWELEGKRRKIRFLNPDLDLINTTDPIPFHFSALGPKGKKLAAETGMNWIIPIRDNDVAIAQLRAMQDEWRSAGRDVAGLYSTAHAGGCILGDGEAADSPRAKAQAGPAAAMVLHDMVEAEYFGTLGYRIPEALRPILDEYKTLYEGYEPEDARYLSVHRGHLMIVRPEEEHLIGGDLIKALSFTATAPELRERIRALGDAGFNQISFHIRYGQDQTVEEWADLVAGV